MLVLFTDTDADVSPKLAEELGFKLISMPYTIGDVTTYPYVDFDEFDYKSFYAHLRQGVMPKTAALNPSEYVNYFEPYFKEGHDILYVHFSRNMSGTFNAVHIAYQELLERYPDRKLHMLDTKGISICSLAIVKEVSKLYKNGKSIEEILKWAEEEVDRYAVYFYADNLEFFKRSGRVSGFAAFMGGIIGLHPIIHMDSDGYMKTKSKARGKKTTLLKIVEYVKELSIDIKNHPVIIAHSDAQDIAEELAKMLEDEFGNLDISYSVVNPTIGSHCGPSCVGVCFYSKHR